MQTSPKMLWVQDLHDVRLGPENRATLGGHHDKHVASGHETAELEAVNCPACSILACTRSFIDPGPPCLLQAAEGFANELTWPLHVWAQMILTMYSQCTLGMKSLLAAACVFLGFVYSRSCLHCPPLSEVEFD